MIAETITVTNTATSVAALVAAARTVTPVPNILPSGDLLLYYPVASTTAIEAEDANSDGSCVLLQGSTESISRCQLRDVDINTLLLVTSTGTQAIDILFSKGDIS